MNATPPPGPPLRPVRTILAVRSNVFRQYPQPIDSCHVCVSRMRKDPPTWKGTNGVIPPQTPTWRSGGEDSFKTTWELALMTNLTPDSAPWNMARKVLNKQVGSWMIIFKIWLNGEAVGVWVCSLNCRFNELNSIFNK